MKKALSQTDSITVYKIPFIKGANVQFNLNIIDTPGTGYFTKKRDRNYHTRTSGRYTPFLFSVGNS